MARLARAVFPEHSYHVTQRGNGRAQTFFDDEDYALYRDLLGAPLRGGRRGDIVLGADAQSFPSRACA